jgi:replicative DNA helicase
MCEKPVFKKVIDFEEAKRLLEQIRRDRGYPSGYKDLDKLCGGLVKDGLTLIAGRPAMGRTSLVLNIVNRLAQQEGGTILICSSQTWAEEFAMRLFCIGTGLEMVRFFDNKLPHTTVATKFLDYYKAKQSRIKFEIDSFLSLDDIWNYSSRIPDLRLVVIDPTEEIYVPVDFSAETIDWDTKKEPPSAIFNSLQQFAHTFGVPVLCTAHLHRSLERRKNKRPHLGDLKKIGIDPEWLDQIIFLYRDRYYDSEGEEGAELIVAKVVQGDVGTVRLNWEGASKCFTERGKDE